MSYTFNQPPLPDLLFTTSFSQTLEWDDAVQEESKITEGKALAPQGEMSLASTAAKVLCAIAQARGSIHEKNIVQATHGLHKARTLIDLLKAVRPTARVKDHIWVAKKHLDYEPTEKVALDLIPIDLALTNLEYFIPVTEAKAHLQAAHKSLINKDKAGAKKHLEAVDHSLVYTEVDLPLAATEHHLGTAQELLADNKPRKADAALEDAEAGVEFISLSVDAPIVHAKKSLWQGMEAYAAGNVDAGKIDLKQAGVWLTHAMQTRDEEVKAEATALAGELRTLAADTKSQGSAIKIALQSLWRKTKALTEREAAQAVVGWQDFRKQSTTTMPLQNTTKLKVDLTDAKFHMTCAEIFEFITHEGDKARTAIEKAQMHLKAAEELANGRIKAEIQGLNQESELIRKELMKKGNSNMNRYMKVKNDIHQFLQELLW